MATCFQFKTIDMLQHGKMVHSTYLQLLKDIAIGQLDKYPKCTEQLWNKYWSTLPSPETIRLYHVYHDCGKHLSLTTDDEGRRHYPNHAENSFNLFRQYNADPIAAELIRHDMHLHTLKGDELDTFIKSFAHIGILWYTALSELFANAELFGGCEQTSFKIKFKQLEKAGKRLLAL